MAFPNATDPSAIPAKPAKLKGGAKPKKVASKPAKKTAKKAARGR